MLKSVNRAKTMADGRPMTMETFAGTRLSVFCRALASNPNPMAVRSTAAMMKRRSDMK